MAERAQAWLLGLLAVQIALALALFFGGGDGGAADARRPLLAFDPAAATRVEIASPEGAAVLVREGAGPDQIWGAERLGGFEIDGERLQRVLTDLAEAARGWPIAHNAAAAERFGVDAALFRKRLTVTVDGRELEPLYLGTSPAIGVAHARLEGETAIYGIDFDAIDAAADDDSWVRRDALALDAERIAFLEITAGGDLVRLVKREAGAGFTLDGLGADETVDDAAVSRAVAAALRPIYSGVEPGGDAADAPLAEPAATVVIQIAGAETLSLRYAVQTDAEGAAEDAATTGPVLFSRSDRPHLFRGRSEDFAALLTATRAGFLVPPPEPAPGAEQTPPEDPEAGAELIPDADPTQEALPEALPDALPDAAPDGLPDAGAAAPADE